ncbi:MAG: glutamine--fructose-6-phosphate transaminase (isomerizing) [Chlamydiae bacterium]|nr:glutamine--fructose-6-phosphate transaminase (isomerizing) [Chlamydiota bacterium]
MCGIFGYIGKGNATALCLEGLKKLEYRGYDSSGIAGVENHKIFVGKELGKITALEKALSGQDHSFSAAIAHTRWATHGKPSKENAHPHLDQHKTVAVVHNGVIENYAALRDRLIQESQTIFSSETDTEVIAQLIAECYEGDFFQAVLKTVKALEGSFAIAVIHKDHPDQMIVVAEKSPLVIGFSPTTKEVFVASDPNALSGRELEVYYLTDGELAILHKDTAPLFFSREGNPSKKHGITQTLSQTAISKGQYPHFMLKEIFEQVLTVKQAMKDRFDEKNQTAYFEEFSFDPEELKKIQSIIIVACGTSYHAACIAAYLFESAAHIETRVEIASEYRYKYPIVKDNTLVLALSQSGETADTIAAVRHVKGKNAKVIALCNVPHSTISREADATILLHAGSEVAVASTKTFTSQVTILYLLTLLLARQRGMSPEEGRLFYRRLYELPDQIIEILNRASEIQALAKKYSKFESFFFLGRGILFPTALEAALKIKEIAYINAQGYPAGEMKHGPIALLTPKVPALVFCANDALQSKIMSNLMESKARGAPILVFGWKEFEKEIMPVADDVFWIPKTSDELACIPLTVATQLFAYYVALDLGAEIDQPRNLAKSVTVE